MNVRKKYVLTVTLNPAMDKIWKGRYVSAGKNSICEKKMLSAGGKGINVTRALNHFGLKSIATGFIGGLAGKHLCQCLQKEGIGFDFVLLNAETRTNTTIIDVRTNQITRLVEEGPRGKSRDFQNLKSKYFSLLRKRWCVVLAGRNLPGIKENVYFDLIDMAKRKNVLTILDASGKSLSFGLKAKPFMIKPNLEEAQYAIDRKLDSLLKVKKAVHFFFAMGIKISIISMGARGAVGFDGHNVYWVKPPKIKVVNPVGCGDAFIAGFLWGIYQKQTFSESMQFAVATGTMNALSLQPGDVRQRNLKRILRRVKVQAL